MLEHIRIISKLNIFFTCLDTSKISLRLILLVNQSSGKPSLDVLKCMRLAVLVSFGYLL